VHAAHIEHKLIVKVAPHVVVADELERLPTLVHEWELHVRGEEEVVQVPLIVGCLVVEAEPVEREEG